MQRELLFDREPIDVQSVTATEAVTLRDYQEHAVEWTLRHYVQPTSTLVVMPTGCGKSVVFSEVMRRFHATYTGRILLLAHRRELLLQAIGHSKRAGLSADLEMAANVAGSCDVVCASVQTLMAKQKCLPCRGTGKHLDDDCGHCTGRGKTLRYEKFNPQEFGLVVIDEAHHSAARTYRTVLQWFGRNADLRVLGVTATPKRSDKIGLSCAYQQSWNHLALPKAIEGGWLVPLRQQFVKCDSLVLTNVRSKAGDFVEADIEAAFLGGSVEEEKRLLHEVAFPVASESGGTKSFIVFAAGVDHAKKLASELQSYPELAGRVELLLGDTGDDERGQILERLRSGKSIGLVNCGVCTEGFDLPSLEIVAIARPTKSEGLYLQMIGRGTRPLPGVVDGPETPQERRSAIAASRKPHCLVMDFVGASGALQQQSVGSVLTGLPIDAEDLIEAVNRALKAVAAVDMERLVKESREEREQRLQEQARQRREARERERQRKIEASGVYAEEGEYTRDTVDLFRSRFDAYRDYQPGPQGATQKQVNLLVKIYGVAPETAMRYTRRQASAVIDSMQRKAAEGAPMPGLVRNKYQGTCVVTGKRVAAGGGWIRKNTLGKWETLSIEGVRQLRRKHSEPVSSGVEEAPF